MSYSVWTYPCDDFIDRIWATKFGWIGMICTDVYDEKCHEQLKILTLFFSASMITIVKANFAKEVLHPEILYSPPVSLITKYVLEAMYTLERHIDFIPCLMEASYIPESWLGISIADYLYVDFSPPKDFDTAIRKLIAEIEAIKAKLQTNSGE
jgi:hypothetical protein